MNLSLKRVAERLGLGHRELMKRMRDKGLLDQRNLRGKARAPRAPLPARRPGLPARLRVCSTSAKPGVHGQPG